MPFAPSFSAAVVFLSLSSTFANGASSHDSPIPASILDAEADEPPIPHHPLAPPIHYEPLPFRVTTQNINILRDRVLVCDVRADPTFHVKLLCNESQGLLDFDFVPEMEFLDEPWTFPFIVDLTICIVCILVSAIASGLTVGMMGMSKVEVGILTRAGTPSEKVRALRVLPLIERHHLLLCTLLLINATAMEALPIFLDHMVPPYLAIILSVTAVLIFGEIIPQALCTRFGLAIGAFLSPLIWVWIGLTLPISYPIAKLLDFLIGEENHLYRRGELKELIALHSEDHPHHRLDGDDSHSDGGRRERPSHHSETTLAGKEIQILQSVLDMRTKTVVRRMTPLEDVFMLALDAKLDEPIMAQIVERGHSRIPVHLPQDRNNVVGMLLSKTLIGLSTTPTPPLVSSLELRPMPVVSDTKPLLDLLKVFQGGRSHMALVLSSEDCVTLRGIVTLEDLIEELLQTEILDETDVVRRASPAIEQQAPVELQSDAALKSSPLAVTVAQGSTSSTSKGFRLGDVGSFR